jgi:glycosyltransferase involved in cell wall biosynthesis
MTASGILDRANRALSVAIYMHDFSGGGVERQTLTLARELQEHGTAVSLVVHRIQGELAGQIPPGLRVVELLGRRTLHDILLLARFLRRERPDVLLTNVDHNNIAGVLAKVVGASRTKVVICQHNALAGEFAVNERWTYRLIPLAYRLLSPFIVAAAGVSNGIAEELVRTAGLPRSKVVTIYNAVIGQDFQQRAGQELAHPWFCDGNGPVFVTAGRLVWQKDHSTLLQALALHRQSGGLGRLLILGTGPLRGLLETQAHGLDVGDAVDFIGFQANPLPWFRRADVFVLSARSEGFGNVLVEAMGCGTPVISTDCDYGPREILESGRYGILVPPRDPHALARVLDSARNLRSRFPASLLMERAAEFNTAKCADRFRSLFNRLVPTHPDPDARTARARIVSTSHKPITSDDPAAPLPGPQAS